MKTFYKSLRISFAILGSYLGIGFLSGREIILYFYNTNIFISAALSFVVYFTLTSLILIMDFKNRSRMYKIFEVVIYLFDFILLAGSLSAVETIFTFLFSSKINPTIASITLLIFLNLIMLNDIRGVKAIGGALVPIIILTIIITLFKVNIELDFKNCNFSPRKIITYSGFNLVISIPTIGSLGKNEKAVSCVFIALLSSLLLSVLIIVLYGLIQTHYNGNNQDFPIMSILSNQKFLYLSFIISMLLGIISTSSNVYFPLYNMFSNNVFGFLGRIIVGLFAILLSRLGFSLIIDKIYPIIGVIGFVTIIIFVFDTIFFQKRRQEDTSRRQVYTK